MIRIADFLVPYLDADIRSTMWLFSPIQILNYSAIQIPTLNKKTQMVVEMKKLKVALHGGDVNNGYYLH